LVEERDAAVERGTCAIRYAQDALRAWDMEAGTAWAQAEAAERRVRELEEDLAFIKLAALGD
jgi:hypothetical protein